MSGTKKASGKGKRQRDNEAIVQDVVDEGARAAPAPPASFGVAPVSCPYKMLLYTAPERPVEFESMVDPATHLYKVFAVYEDETRRLVCKGLRSAAMANKCVDTARFVRSIVDKCNDTGKNFTATRTKAETIWSIFELELSQQRTDDVYSSTLFIDDARQRAVAMLHTSLRTIPLDRFGDAAFPRTDVRAFYTIPMNSSTAIYARLDGISEPILCKVFGSGQEEEARRTIVRFRALANRQTLADDIEFFDCEPLTAAERRAGGLGQLAEVTSRGSEKSVAAHQEFLDGDEQAAITAEKIQKAQTVGKMVREAAKDGESVSIEKSESGKLEIKIREQEEDADADTDDKVLKARIIEKK